MYSFSDIVRLHKESILNELLDKHVICIDKYDVKKVQKVADFYEKVLQDLCQNIDEEKIIADFTELAKYKFSINVPYTIITNEIFGLKNILLSKLADNNKNDHNNSLEIFQLITIFKQINDSIAYIYLTHYITQLVSINNVRLSSISDLMEIDIIKHYQSHVVWLSDLALSIRNFQKNEFPQRSESLCDFGQWLQKDARVIIQNNSKFKTLDELHKSLHMFAKKIYLLLIYKDKHNYKEYHALISYLEKCELISLSIGTELALIDNSAINKKKNKDILTGALNRNNLHSIFTTQYELSRATDNTFMIAMCDLDYFKNINDTYGHIAGDKMLKLFVDTVKEHIRNSDLIIRYGGEEFLIILSAIQKEQSLLVLQKIRESFALKILEFEQQNISATVSIGATEIIPRREYRSDFVDEYLMIADKMLYLAKNNGRNRIEIV